MLNAKKSGIVEFLPRSKTHPPTLKNGAILEDIPIVTDYKYLGLIVDQKLTSQKQRKHIEDKTKHQCAALWAILKAISLSERMHLWTMLTRPLFEMLIFPYYAERSKTYVEKIHNMLIRTFKKFSLFRQNTNTKLIERLMNYNFAERAGLIVEITKLKWIARMNNEAPDKSIFPKKINAKDKQKQIWYPREVVELINLKTALCKQCSTPCNSNHLQTYHNIEIPSNDEILNLAEKQSEEYSKDPSLEKEILNKIGETFKTYIN